MSPGSARQDICPSCDGKDGHHYLACEFLASDGVDDVDLGVDAESFADRIGIPEGRRAGIDEQAAALLDDINRSREAIGVESIGFDGQKIPPTPDDVASNELLWLVARTCHEVNRAYCAAILGDHSHKPWDEAPAQQRESAYNGVRLHFEHPETTPEDSHESWMREKLAEGWTHSNAKNEELKTHPCLVSYSMLHKHDRAKDAIFQAVCRGFFGS